MTTTTKERADLDPVALTLMYQLANTYPYLYAERLPGETAEELAARQAAAADITDHHLALMARASVDREAIAGVATLNRERAQAHTARAADEIAA